MKQRNRSRVQRAAGAIAMVVLGVLLALVASAELVSAVSHSGYDSHENRAPEWRIATAAAAAVSAVVVLFMTFWQLRGSTSWRATAIPALWLLTAFLIGLSWSVSVLSGPL